MRYKDLETMQCDSYYSIADRILEEPEITFIYAGTKKYIDELLINKEKYNIQEDDIEEFFENCIIKTSEFYEEHLRYLNRFNKLEIFEKIELMYLFLKKELPHWISEETEYIDDDVLDIENSNYDEPYDVNQIDIINSTFQAEYLLKKYKYGELQLSPDYQRNFVWTSRQKSRLIESILIKIPLPIFYIDARNEEEWVVIDGLQRLTSIFTYMQDEFKLSSLEYLTQLNGKKFSKLERKYQRRIEDFQLLCNLVRPNTPANIAFNIFQRINTLGTKLEIQEIRNAMYRGESTSLLTKLANSDEFVKIVTKSRVKALSKRMEDHAIILRYLSFKVTNYLEYDNNDMNRFLSNSMQKINQMNEFEIKSLENTFSDCMNKAYILFDENAFRKPLKAEERSNPISKSLFESIGYTLDKYSIDDIQKNKTFLNQKINELFGDEEFILKTSIATNNPVNVHYRFDKFQEIFKDVIGY